MLELRSQRAARARGEDQLPTDGSGGCWAPIGSPPTWPATRVPLQPTLPKPRDGLLPGARPLPTSRYLPGPYRHQAAPGGRPRRPRRAGTRRAFREPPLENCRPGWVRLWIRRGLRDGTGPVDNVDLLGPPNNTTYPILQTKIVQEVHLFRTAYDVNQRLSATVVLPFIQQLTDHVSLVPGYKDFTITSKGIGDMSLSLSGLVHQGARDSVTTNGGISVPTGSITEKGNTPAGPGSQLPYTMQLGSGTWDIPSRSELSARNERCGSFRSCSVPSPGHWKGSNRREFSRVSTGASPGVGRLRVDSAAEMAFPISRPVQ